MMHQMKETHSFFKNSAPTTQGNTVFAPVKVTNDNFHRTKETQNTTAEQMQGSLKENSMEKVGMLHQKLHQEADKIRKWKTQTELELHQKEKSIQEANKTVESQRKSILELQLHNETLSLKVQEEIDNKKEMVQRIVATREMVNILKNYSSGVEERLQSCERDRTDLKYLEKEHLKEFEELSNSFKQLEIASNDMRVNFTNEIKQSQLEKQNLKEEYNERLTTEIQKLEAQMQECKEKDLKIMNMMSHLQTVESTLHETKQKYYALQEAHSESEKVIAQTEESLKETCQELHSGKASEKMLQRKLEETTNELFEANSVKEKNARNFDETEKLYVEKLKTLETDLCQMKSQAVAQRTRNNDLDAQVIKYQASVEELKCVKDMIMLEKADLQKEIQDLQKEKNYFAQELTEVKERFEKMDASNSAKTEEIIQLKIIETTLKTKLDDVKLELENAFQQETKYKEIIENLKIDLESENEKIKKLKDDAKANAKRDETKSKRENAKLEKLEEQSEKKIQEVTDLKKKLQNVEQELKEITKKGKSDDKKMEKLEKQLAVKSQEVTDRDEKMANVEKELKDLTENDNKKLQVLTKAEEKARKETEAAEKKCDIQIKRTAKILEDYKRENDKIVALKEKELQETIQKLQNNNSKEQECQTLKEDRLNLEKQIQQLNETLVLKKEKIEDLTEKTNKLTEMKENLHSKEEENKRLVLEIQKLKNKLLENEDHKAKISAANAPCTPKITTPKNTSESSNRGRQRSILKQITSSVSKKRRVSFSPSREESDSSQDWIEVEATEIEDHFKHIGSKQTSTPLVLRASFKPASTPNQVQTTGTPARAIGTYGTPTRTLKTYSTPKRSAGSTSKRMEENASPLTLIPVPRLPPQPRQQKASKMNIKDAEMKEREKFEELYPEMEIEASDAKNKSKKKAPRKNIKQTPVRKTPKPASYSKLKSRKSKQDMTELAWFDTDAIFGFGPED